VAPATFTGAASQHSYSAGFGMLAGAFAAVAFVV